MDHNDIRCFLEGTQNVQGILHTQQVDHGEHPQVGAAVNEQVDGFCRRVTQHGDRCRAGLMGHVNLTQCAIQHFHVCHNVSRPQSADRADTTHPI